MRISKSQSIVISLLLLVAFFVGGILLLKSSENSRPPRSAESAAVASTSLEKISGSLEKISREPSTAETSSSPTPKLANALRTPRSTASRQENGTPAALGPPTTTEGIEATPSSAQVQLGNFHRLETKNGKLLWEVEALKGDYSPRDNSASLEKPVMHFLRKDGAKVTLTSLTATVFMQGAGLSHADLEGEVTSEFQGYVLRAARATYDQPAAKVTVPVPVTIDGPQLAISSNSLIAHTDTQVYIFEGAVRTTIKARSKENPRGSRKKNSTEKS